jgi:hypothetical protein
MGNIIRSYSLQGEDTRNIGRVTIMEISLVLIDDRDKNETGIHSTANRRRKTSRVTG